MTMQQRRIGPFQVSAIGLGCMNLSHAYGAPPMAEDAERLLLRALDLGVTLFDTAALYGFGGNETLVGRVLKAHRSHITLCSKGGMAGVQFDDGLKRVIDGSPAAIRRNCEDSLRRLGVEVIDLYYLHRWDQKVPIEESVGEMARLKAEGKVRALGLSEVSAATLRRAHAEHPIAALQTEYSLWTRNPEIAVLDYQTTQTKVIPMLATCYALHFSKVRGGCYLADPLQGSRKGLSHCIPFPPSPPSPPPFRISWWSGTAT